jgi:glycosidase
MKMLANLYLLSPGSPFIYYGEELGIRGSRGGANTDANRRLAMLWGDGDTIENPEGTTYPATAQIKTTVVDQLADEGSMLNHYSKLIAIRNRYPAIARGDYNAVSVSTNFGGFWVEYQGEVIGIFHNTSLEPITIDLTGCSGIDGHSFAEVLDFVGEGTATIENNVLTLEGFTTVILR